MSIIEFWQSSKSGHLDKRENDQIIVFLIEIERPSQTNSKVITSPRLYVILEKNKTVLIYTINAYR